MKLGIKLAEKRKELGITQLELAEKMHVTRQTVSRWESGTAFPDIEKVAELAEYLNVSCDFLLKDDEKATNKNSVNGPSKLLSNLVGKKIKLNFFGEEADIDLCDKVCTLEGFEGNWMNLKVETDKQTVSKLVAASSVLSIEIVEDK